MHTTQNIGLGSKSKVDSTLSLTANSASYSTNSVNLGAGPASYSTNSVKIVADHAKSCCSSNTVSKTLTADSAVPCDTNSDTQCANENSDEDYLNEIIGIWKPRKKGASPEWKTDKNFSRSDLEQHKTWKKFRIF